MSVRQFASTFDISGRRVGGGAPTLVIAEVAQAHDGSLGMAHSFIDCAADCGADAIKFQTHIASEESTLDEEFRIRFSYVDTNRYDYWARMEFTAEQWVGLASHAHSRGLLFLSSPFSLAAVSLLERIGMPAWKVASGEVKHFELIDAMLATRKPILLSSGLSSFSELDDTVDYIRRSNEESELGVFQCTTRYPTPLEEIGLNVLDELAFRYDIPVGLSDHSGDILPSIAAMARGASMVEVHLAFHSSMFGPDTAASLVPSQLTELCRARDSIHRMLTHPISKDAVASDLSGSARLFGRSLSLAEPQPAGTLISSDMLVLRKPGTGIPPSDRGLIVGRVLKHDVSSNRLLREDDLEPIKGE